MNPSSIHQVTRREQGAEQKRADREKGFPKDDDVAGEAEGRGNRDAVKGPRYVTVPQGVLTEWAAKWHMVLSLSDRGPCDELEGNLRP